MGQLTNQDLLISWRKLNHEGYSREESLKLVAEKYKLPVHEVAERILEVI